MEAIKELNIDNSEGETQIAIRKKINLSNQWMLFIFPTDRKEHVQMIDAKIRQIGASFRKYREHLAESKKCRLRDDLDEAESHIKKAQAALQQAGNCHEKVKELLLNETLSIMSNITNPTVKTRTLNNNACDISNVRGPVILLAVESINFGDGFESYHGWYKEYTPFSPVTWDLY